MEMLLGVRMRASQRLASVTGESVWHYPEYRHWSSEHAEYYYVDPETKGTTWDVPEKYAWEELNDPESGKTYYHNKKTKETTWDKPEQFAWKRVVAKQEL
ncbi:WW domain-containing protein [Chloropicon primus]|uniref:WW domain-containing protein n=1 Tax=Chloropicon primus TaxID=1764295 RepID=A0A5B8MIE8_9CHLO|nr:hypothetical protein A3770_03p26770 [Chloropicon primus]UPQ99370.1 WW domain-containing protein [Chloropicon primus]|eukprot:QDZ20159.1 hypothetical protein A3770_03p26770 [Chloropicon primus]